MQRSKRNEGDGKVNSGSRFFLKLLIFVLLAGALLLWLEWMGSEQEMELIEQSVPMPQEMEN